MWSKNMTYFLHAGCGNNLHLDVTSCFKIITSFGIGKSVLRARTGKFIQVAETTRTIFYCTSCGKSIENLKEVMGTCMFCGNNFPIEEMVSPSTSGGMYCKEHGTKERFPDEVIRPLKNIISKMSIK